MWMDRLCISEEYPMYDYSHINLTQEEIEKILSEYSVQYNEKKDKTE
jgi:hypothetical protein